MSCILTTSFTPEHPKTGIYSQSLSLFEDISVSMLEAINELDTAPLVAPSLDCVALVTPPLVSSVIPSTPILDFSLSQIYP